MKKKLKTTTKYFIILLFLMLTCYILYSAVSIWNYGKVDEKRSADTVIVLGAGTRDGKVSPVFRERINHGIWLYQNGYANSLILTGGYGEGSILSDAYIAKVYVLQQGVPEDAVLLEEASVITQENLGYAKKIMEEQDFSTAIIVSDPLHMKRAMLMAKDFGIEAYSSPTPTTRYVSAKTKLAFLSREVFFYIGYKGYRIIK